MESKYFIKQIQEQKEIVLKIKESLFKEWLGEINTKYSIKNPALGKIFGNIAVNISQITCDYLEEFSLTKGSYPLNLFLDKLETSVNLLNGCQKKHNSAGNNTKEEAEEEIIFNLKKVIDNLEEAEKTY